MFLSSSALSGFCRQSSHPVHASECQCHDLSRVTAEYGHVSQLIRRSLFLGVTLVIMCVHRLFDAIHYAYLLETVSAYLNPSFSFLIIYRHRGNSRFSNNP